MQQRNNSIRYGDQLIDLIEDSSHSSSSKDRTRSFDEKSVIFLFQASHHYIRRCNFFPLLAVPLQQQLRPPNGSHPPCPLDSEVQSEAVDVAGLQQWTGVVGGHGCRASECLHSHWIWIAMDRLLIQGIRDVEIPHPHPRQGRFLQCSQNLEARNVYVSSYV